MAEKHLALLREEHVGLQNRHAELQRRYDILLASVNLKLNNDGIGTDGQHHLPPTTVAGGGDNSGVAVNESFVERIVKTVGLLFDKELYSDITVHLEGHQVRAHRFVLAARSTSWGVQDLAEVDRLDFSDVDYTVGLTLLKWVYTDMLDSKLGDSFLLNLIKAAQRFKLLPLIERSERILISRLDATNCIPFYQVADEIALTKLRDSCSHLITIRWDEFTPDDFVTMSASLLYKMLKSKSQYPLHAAIRLKREDVVFLYLIEFDNDLETAVNALDADDDLPLSLALKSCHEAIAKTLISHKANVDTRDANGCSLLYATVEQNDIFACRFLLAHGADLAFCHETTGRTVLHALAAASNRCQTDTETTKDADAAVVGGMADMEDAVVSSDVIDRILNQKDRDGKTALHVCVQSKNGRLLKKLLVLPHLDLNVGDNLGNDPLRYALLDDELIMAKSLVDAGADVNAVRASDNYSLLHDCASNGLEESVRFLIAQSVDVNSVDLQGETALHLSIDRGLPAIATLLVDAGTDLNVANSAERGMNTALHLAVSNGCGDVVDAIIHAAINSPNRMEINSRNGASESAFSLALFSGDFHLADKLVKGIHCDVNLKWTTDAAGEMTLLLRAICEQNQQVALFLLDHGATAAARTSCGRSALQEAVRRPMCHLVRALCKAGADLNELEPDVGSDGDASSNPFSNESPPSALPTSPPLWVALCGDLEDNASTLVEYGCDTNAWAEGPGGCLQTLLHRAIDANNQPAACFLIRSGCDVNAVRKVSADGRGVDEAADRHAPLHMAVTWALTDVVDTLITHGANINAQDADGSTPVHLAVLNHNQPALAVLLESNLANLTLQNRQGQTAFGVALKVKNNKAARSILDKDSRIANLVNNKGWSLLHSATKADDLEAVLFLLSVNIDVNVPTQDAQRLTALHIASERGNEMIVRNLLLAGADVNVAASTRRRTPLHLASAADRAVVVQILLDNGADCDAVDDHRDNALHTAVRSASISCARVLLTESRINASAVNLKGQTPLHLLGIHGKENAAAIFDLFLETMHDYPVDQADADGNTVLLYAYMNGQAQLCRTAVRYGVCLGHSNCQGISIFNYQTPTKQLLFKLLDQLAREPRWAEGDYCSECTSKFNITTRRHHCRHCGRLLCSKCSERQIPILKYDLQKQVRVCDVCYDVLTLGAQ